MSRTARSRPKGYEPLAPAPKKAQARFGTTAHRAHRGPMAAIKLKCLECCAWEYSEAKRCEIRTCPLWALNRWIFARDGLNHAGESES